MSFQPQQWPHNWFHSLLMIPSYMCYFWAVYSLVHRLFLGTSAFSWNGCHSSKRHAFLGWSRGRHPPWDSPTKNLRWLGLAVNSIIYCREHDTITIPRSKPSHNTVGKWPCWRYSTPTQTSLSCLCHHLLQRPCSHSSPTHLCACYLCSSATCVVWLFWGRHEQISIHPRWGTNNNHRNYFTGQDQWANKLAKIMFRSIGEGLYMRHSKECI